MAAMSFDQIVQRVMTRMNLSSDDARTRIGDNVNERYVWLCTSMGLQTAVQEEASAFTVIGSNELTFGPSPKKVIKVMDVYNPAIPKPNALTEVSLDQLRVSILTTDPAQMYTVWRMGADRVTIKINVTAGSVYELDADVIVDKAELSGADVPTFSSGYHNLLYYGAMATEYDKMENDEKAAEFEAKFEQRCSELRLFIAKSMFKDIYQGKTAPGPILVNRNV